MYGPRIQCCDELGTVGGLGDATERNDSSELQTDFLSVLYKYSCDWLSVIAFNNSKQIYHDI